MSDVVPGFGPMTRGQRRALLACVLGALLLGAAVEVRSAFQQRRKTDLGVYLRAAWAVRAGADPYAITDNNGWHYCYPPLLAILLTPFADSPAGAEPVAAVPYAASVAIWYLFGWGCLAFSAHWLASAVEATSPDPLVRRTPAFCRRWWALRAVPAGLCLPAAGYTLSRGQVNLLLLLLLSGFVAGCVRGRPVRAGLWLGGAVCLKLIPAFLLLYPLGRRDWRMLGACSAATAAGLFLVPALVWGPVGAWESCERLGDVLLRPAVSGGGDQTRSRELTSATGAADNQSVQAVLHRLRHPDPVTRSAQPEPSTRLAHWLSGAALTALTLAAAWRRRLAGAALVIWLGALTVVMALLSPVCHLHYFCLALPLGTGLLAAAWERGGGFHNPVLLSTGFTVYAVLYAVVLLPGDFLTTVREGGLMALATLALWLTGLVAVRRAGGRTASAPVRLPQAA
jgi:hypothetical protein